MNIKKHVRLTYMVYTYTYVYTQYCVRFIHEALKPTALQIAFATTYKWQQLKSLATRVLAGARHCEFEHFYE